MTSESNPLVTLDKKAARVNQVFAWILSGATEHEVSEAIAAAWPDAKPKPLIVAAIQRIRESAAIDAETVTGFCVEATRDLYRRMIADGDFAGALKAIKQLSEIARRHGTICKEEPKA